MTQTKNYCTVVGTQVTPTGIALRLYTHTPEGRFLSVGWVYFQRSVLEDYAEAVRREEEKAAQPMLPPWDEESDDNVRWLPPQP